MQKQRQINQQLKNSVHAERRMHGRRGSEGKVEHYVIQQYYSWIVLLLLPRENEENICPCK